MSGSPGPGGTWRCAICEEQHEGLATVLGPLEPDPWALATDDQRARGELNRDMCVLPADDTTYYFIRGELQVPVVDAEIGPFVWSTWASLSGTSMQTTVEHWEDPERAELPPMFGWLSNGMLPYDPPPANLPLSVQTRAPGVVPLFEVDPASDHPLAREQRDGITLHRVAELNRLLLQG